jgi:predicted amidohydrolase YtcJ
VKPVSSAKSRRATSWRLSASCLLLLASTVFATTLVAAAQSSDPSSSGRSDLAPDLILVNGKIITFDKRDRTVSGVAIKGDRILAVGSASQVRQLAGPKTRVVDVKGRLVLPGLVDAHSHTTGVSPDYLDLTEARTIPAILDAVRRKVEKTPAGQWIIAAGPFMFWRGWDDGRLQEKRLINRWDLDPVTPNHPVLLMKDAGHAVVLNSYALKVANITKETPDPDGQIPKDAKTGEPTGILLESAMDLAFAHLPPATREDRISAAGHASDQLLRYGTTSVANMSVLPEDILAFQALYEARKEPLVTTVLCPLVPTRQPLPECLDFVRRWPFISGFGNSQLKLGALKIFVDGGITGRAAWFKEPYKDRPGFYGIPQVEKETLFEVVRLADQMGWQIHLHACGDAAAELALDALENAQKKNKTSGRRHILTHLYVLSPEMITRLKRLDVIAVLQPNFVYSLGEHMRAALSRSQLEHIIPMRALLNSGVRVALSADGLPQNPMLGIYAAVARKTDLGNVLAPSEAVSVMEALRAYTQTSAFALGEEDKRGSIEVGKIADLIVLDRDLLKVYPEEIKDAQILLTIKSGVIAVNRLGNSQ